mmetsp:Transcript_6242/g.24337  ORF Transcript_6242/g.24337 Transcript_6242/m.24337 type:complete len:255 (-) Transcript_6242:770-1534(-)
MRREQASAAEGLSHMLTDRPCDAETVKCVRTPSKLVDDEQAGAISFLQHARHLGALAEERRVALRLIVRRAYPGQDPREERRPHRLRGHEAAHLRKQHGDGDRSDERGLPSAVGPRHDAHAAILGAGHAKIVGDELVPTDRRDAGMLQPFDLQEELAARILQLQQLRARPIIHRGDVRQCGHGVQLAEQFCRLIQYVAVGGSHLQSLVFHLPLHTEVLALHPIHFRRRPFHRSRGEKHAGALHGESLRSCHFLE